MLCKFYKNIILIGKQRFELVPTMGLGPNTMRKHSDIDL